MRLLDLGKELMVFTAARALAKLLGAIAVLLFARAVGPAVFGRITAALALVYLIQPASTFGGFGEAVRKAESRKAREIEESMLFFVMVSLLFAVFLGFILKLLNLPWFFALYLPVLNLFLAYRAVLIIRGEKEKVVKYITSERFLFLAALLGFYKLLTPEFAYFLALFFSNISAFILFGGKLPVMLKVVFNPYFFVSAVFQGVASRITPVIIKVKFGDVATGNYGIAYQLFVATSMLLQEARKYFLYRFRLLNENQTKKVERSLFLAGLMLLLLLYVAYRPVVELGRMLFGEKFAKSPELLGVLFLGLPAQLFSAVAYTQLYYASPPLLCIGAMLYGIVTPAAVSLAKTLKEATVYRVLTLYLNAAWLILLAKLLRKKRREK